MNIISNNCLGGFIYKYADHPYNNPFVWTAIYGNSLERIIFDYDTVNFNDIWLHDVSGRRTYNLVIDNKLDVKFWGHYKYDELANTPIKRGDSIYSKDIESFICSTYRKRLSRMKEPPIFVLHWWLGMSVGTSDYWRTTPPSNDLCYLQSLCNRTSKYKIIIFHPYSELGNSQYGNTICLHEELCMFPKRSPAFVAKKRLNDILQLIT